MKDQKKELNKKDQLDEKTMEQVNGGYYDHSRNSVHPNQGKTNESNCINPKQPIIRI